MKRLFKIVTSLLCVVITILITGCSGEVANDTVKEKLVQVIENYNFDRGEATITADGKDSGINCTLRFVKNQNTISADAYLMSYTNYGDYVDRAGTSLYLRGDNIYGLLNADTKSADKIVIASKNYEAELNKYITDKLGSPDYLCTTKDVAKTFEQLINSFSVSPQLIYLFMDMFASYIKTPVAINQGDATTVYNGYRLSVDFVSIMSAFLDKLVNMAVVVDKNPTITIEEFVKHNTFLQYFEQIISCYSGKQIQSLIEVLNQRLQENGSSVKFEAISSNEGENGYSYLLRFLNTKVMGLTVGAFRFADIFEIVTDKKVNSFEDYFAERRLSVLQAVKSITNALRIVYCFDEGMNLTKISSDFNLKGYDILSWGDGLANTNIHVKINLVFTLSTNLFEI